MPMPRNNQKLIILICGLLVFLFPFIIYLNSLQNGFLAGDDEEIMQRNHYLRNWQDFPKFFTENYKAGSGTISNYYRPFLLLTFGLITKTAGFNPLFFHLASLLFHALCGLLLYLILLKLFYPKIILPIITFLPLLWLSHPAFNVEFASIAGICSSSCLFWILLGIISFYNYANAGRIKWYIISLSAFIFSLFSKESAIIFPGLLLGAHIVCVKIGALKKVSLKQGFLLHAAFWLIASAYILLRLTILNFDNTLNFYNHANIFTQNFSFRLYTFFTILSRGLSIIFLPIGLHPDTSWPIFTNFFHPRVFFSFLALSLLIIIAIIFRKKGPLFSFGIFWFFFSYLPMSNLAAVINGLVWDHWLYTPSVGILLSLTCLLRKKSMQKFSCFLLVMIVIIFSVVTISRNPYWKDTETISRFILRYEPNSVRSWNNLAIALADKGKFQEAIEDYTKAIALQDTYPQSRHNLANAYAALGKYELAEKEYLRAIAIDSRFFYAYLALGKLYLMRGDKVKAADYLRKALEIYPGLLEARELLKRLR